MAVTKTAREAAARRASLENIIGEGEGDEKDKEM